MQERWKSVQGYEGLYEVSDLGRVRSLKRATTRGIVLKLKESKRGYVVVCLCKGNKRSTISVHRLVASAFIPNPYGKREVNHIDGNRSNNNASNLEWVTRSENERHAYQVLGKEPSRPWAGKPRKFARVFSDADVIAIRSDKRPSRQVAAGYGVSKTTILNIRKRKIYTEV